ncbi:MAG: copper resistance protein CopZ [Odoribacter sp.]|nr:copper resistance protein CopZ [Odoribacter sp.]
MSNKKFIYLPLNYLIMKTIQKFIILMLLVAVPALTIAQDKEKNVQTVKYTTSITCGACVNKIMTNLPHEKGIKDVKCDVKTKEVTVAYQKDKNSPDEIQKSLEKLGFTAKQVKEDETTVKKEK